MCVFVFFPFFPVAIFHLLFEFSFFFPFFIFWSFFNFFFFLFLAAEIPQTVKNNTRRGGERELDAQMGPWPDTKRRGHRKKATRTRGLGGVGWGGVELHYSQL